LKPWTNEIEINGVKYLMVGYSIKAEDIGSD